jgi:hypothetical protein
MNTEQQIKSIGGTGIVTPADLEDFSDAQRAIAELMNDGDWHDAQAIIDASGQREGLRRLRALRAKGFTVEQKRRDNDSREFKYRLTRAARPDAPNRPETPAPTAPAPTPEPPAQSGGYVRQTATQQLDFSL